MKITAYDRTLRAHYGPDDLAAALDDAETEDVSPEWRAALARAEARGIRRGAFCQRTIAREQGLPMPVTRRGEPLTAEPPLDSSQGI